MKLSKIRFYLALSLGLTGCLVSVQPLVLAQGVPPAVRNTDLGGTGFGSEIRGGPAGFGGGFGTRIALPSSEAEEAVCAAAATLLVELEAGTFTTENGIAIAPDVQQALQVALTNPTEANSEILINALVANSNVTTQEAEALVYALSGLLRLAVISAVPEGENLVASNVLPQLIAQSCPNRFAIDAEQFLEAVEAYNVIIDRLSVEELRNPPAVILGIRTVLSELVQSARITGTR